MVSSVAKSKDQPWAKWTASHPAAAPTSRTDVALLLWTMLTGDPFGASICLEYDRNQTIGISRTRLVPNFSKLRILYWKSAPCIGHVPQVAAIAILRVVHVAKILFNPQEQPLDEENMNFKLLVESLLVTSIFFHGYEHMLNLLSLCCYLQIIQFIVFDGSPSTKLGEVQTSDFQVPFSTKKLRLQISSPFQQKRSKTMPWPWHFKRLTTTVQGSKFPIDSTRWLAPPRRSPQDWPNPRSSVPWDSPEWIAT